MAQQSGESVIVAFFVVSFIVMLSATTLVSILAYSTITKLQTDFNSLQSDYWNLNSLYQSLLSNYSALQDKYNRLNQEIASLYTIYEKIQISSAYSSYSSSMNSSTGGWAVTVNVQNTGTADATISNLLINGKPWNDPSYISGAAGSSEYVCNISPSTLTSAGGLPLASGKSATITFSIVKGLGFTSGVSVEIKLQSASGNDYPTTITLS